MKGRFLFISLPSGKNLALRRQFRAQGIERTLQPGVVLPFPADVGSLCPHLV